MSTMASSYSEVSVSQHLSPSSAGLFSLPLLSQCSGVCARIHVFACMRVCEGCVYACVVVLCGQYVCVCELCMCVCMYVHVCVCLCSVSCVGSICEFVSCVCVFTCMHMC